MRSESDFNISDKTGFVQDGFVLSWEPLGPHQIADLLDILEDDERQVPTATS